MIGAHALPCVQKIYHKGLWRPRALTHLLLWQVPCSQGPVCEAVRMSDVRFWHILTSSREKKSNRAKRSRGRFHFRVWMMHPNCEFWSCRRKRSKKVTIPPRCTLWKAVCAWLCDSFQLWRPSTFAESQFSDSNKFANFSCELRAPLCPTVGIFAYLREFLLWDSSDLVSFCCDVRATL